MGGQILSEVLPYLEISQGNPEEIELRNGITVPNIIGKTIAEARKTLKEYKLELFTEQAVDEENVVVNSQIPQEGINVYEGSFVYID